jgi:predicted Zn-dependent protease
MRKIFTPPTPNEKPRRTVRQTSLSLLGLWMMAMLAACATSPLGRSQLLMFSNSQLDAMGKSAFAQAKEKTPTTKSSVTNAYVRCVARAITAALPEGQPTTWEVEVFDDDSANAFALPGGYIGVHTGLLQVAENKDQLATVVGHEVAHVLAQHPNERVSTTALAQTGLQLAEIAAGGGGGAGQRQLFGLLGMGTQVGILLPFGRAQETEADLLGLDLMAAAGFDPRQSVELWRNMGEQGGERPPEFLSTHPTGSTRIQNLDERMSHALKIYDGARAAGHRPNCKAPAIAAKKPAKR